MSSLKNRGSIIPSTLIASAILGFLTLTGMYLLPAHKSELISPTLELKSSTHNSIVGEEFTVDIVVTSDLPVNAFRGLVSFNEEVLAVTKIDYNTSLADLWAITPWYKNGAGTIEFAGGTTRTGGFTGTEKLLSITFTALSPGNGELVLNDTQILQHDGYGTDTLLVDYIDTIFVIASSTPTEIIEHSTMTIAHITVLEQRPRPDLNQDGKINIKDISIFLLHLSQADRRADFNNDGRVTTADLSILLEAE
jgi:hypothetical protein